MLGRVLRAQSGFFWVQTEVGIRSCRLRGRLKKERQRSDIAVIGDTVEITLLSDTEGVIESIIERQSTFSRKQPGLGGQRKEDVLIANLDQVMIVFACDSPPMKPRLLDRFLVVAEYTAIDAVIIANKVDLVGEENARQLFGIYERIGYAVLYVSAQTGLGIAELRERLSGRISVFTGPSGVGKSSLLNEVQPGLHLRTSEVSQTLNKGRHTTVVAELHPLDGTGGYVADTPGIRELEAWSIPDEELAWCFRDIRPLLGKCDFNDCSHTHEPGCVVQQARDDGILAAERYESYVRQLLKAER